MPHAPALASVRRLALAALALAATLGLGGCGYNEFQQLDEGVKASWADVLAQYQRRADLIPNIVATVKGTLVLGTLFGALYSPLASSLVPALIERAERNDFQGMLALAMMNDGLGDNMAVGMQMSVMCAEDGTRITPDELKREIEGSLFGDKLIEQRMKTCEFWPKAKIDPAYYQPLKSAVPTLIMSGELDPVTPPTWGEMVHKNLPRSKHVIAPGTGHGVIGTGCGQRLVHDFIQRGTTEGIDESCLKVLKRPPFFLTPAGPDPSATGIPGSGGPEGPTS
jgi:pimeloyl-ACP methyl ester carboxylesterase